jgi:hypothetical protein
MPERPFATCEDDMPTLYGLHNFFSALSSVPLMAVPIIPLYRSIIRKLPFPVIVQMTCLTGLFLSNLLHHCTYHNAFFVRASSWYNISSAFSMVTCVAPQVLLGTSIRKPRQLNWGRRDGPLLLVFVIWACFQYFMSLQNTLEEEWHIYERVDGMCSLVIILTMGSAAKKLARVAASPGQKTLWYDFCWALVAFIALNIAAPFEKLLCGLEGGDAVWYLKHSFHAVPVHILIAILFRNAADLALRLVEGAAVVANLESKKKL